MALRQLYQWLTLQGPAAYLAGTRWGISQLVDDCQVLLANSGLSAEVRPPARVLYATHGVPMSSGTEWSMTGGFEQWGPTSPPLSSSAGCALGTGNRRQRLQRPSVWLLNRQPAPTSGLEAARAHERTTCRRSHPHRIEQSAFPQGTAGDVEAGEGLQLERGRIVIGHVFALLGFACCALNGALTAVARGRSRGCRRCSGTSGGLGRRRARARARSRGSR